MLHDTRSKLMIMHFLLKFYFYTFHNQSGMDLLHGGGGGGAPPLALARGVAGGAVFHDKAKKY